VTEQGGAGRARGIGATALGCLHLRVDGDNGTEDVVLERRWPDSGAARAWCEHIALDTAVEVVEMKVFVEHWAHPRSWEAGGPHPVPATVQRAQAAAGVIAWADEEPVVGESGSRSAR
jgi:hypothetical protein